MELMTKVFELPEDCGSVGELMKPRLFELLLSRSALISSTYSSFHGGIFARRSHPDPTRNDAISSVRSEKRSHRRRSLREGVAASLMGNYPMVPPGPGRLAPLATCACICRCTSCARAVKCVLRSCKIPLSAFCPVSFKLPFVLAMLTNSSSMD